MIPCNMSVDGIEPVSPENGANLDGFANIRDGHACRVRGFAITSFDKEDAVCL